ncbi:MAG: DUF692 domain-containing protein [Rhodospirillaceae bacterium]|nr:DUF692 domain-containing protein [Rhodospirillaceae bacterium]
MTSPPPDNHLSTRSDRLSPIPVEAGVGLRHPHMSDFVAGTPKTAWVEIHSENFFAPGGPRLAELDAVRSHYPVSCHGVGLSLGSAEGIDENHLSTLSTLVNRIEPGLVSEHLSFSVVDGVYVNDLLPLPYTEEVLAIMVRNVGHVQSTLGRQLLVENPSSYLTFAESVIPEWEFLSALVERTGCGLLLDVNNIYVSAENNDFNTNQYIENIPGDAVHEIHLAGHLVDGEGEEQLLIDTHSDVVAEAVWAVYEAALEIIGPRPTLIEWDTDIPALDVLLAEAEQAQRRMGTDLRASDVA